MSTLRSTCAVVAMAVCVAAPRPATVAPDVTIPFELVVKHVVVQVTVGDSKPLSFVLDTGDKYGLIDIDRAKALGVTLGQEVNVGGAGAQMMKGAMVSGSTFGLPQLPGFSQPIVLALPLASLAAKLGSDFDGIIGADFISAFVVELNYQTRTLTLHDKDTFTYEGRAQACRFSSTRKAIRLRMAWSRRLAVRRSRASSCWTRDRAGRSRSTARS